MKVGSSYAKGDKVVFLFSLLVFAYFSLLILSSQLKWDPVFLGVLRELVTLPAIVGVLVLLVLSAMAFVKGNFKVNSFAFYSLLLVVLTIAAMIGFA
jgi:hypothetical protein